jgi:uncharacterized YigZ family protein
MTRIPSQTHSLEQTIKRSRFVATVAPLQASDQATDLLASLRDASAGHHCWAWQFGDHYRSDDDGEPGGTAGRPILAAIGGQGFDQTLVLVQRWFGGIKLGTGGLARAYGGSAAKCLQQTPSERLIATRQLLLQCAHDHIGLLHSACQHHQADILDEIWSDQVVCLQVELPADLHEALEQHLRDASSGQIQCRALS